MKKIITLLLCFVTIFSLCVTGFAATEDTRQPETSSEFQLEIDVNKRYTDISEMDEYEQELFGDYKSAEEVARDSRKVIYITVLCVLLLVAVIILIVSLKRVQQSDDSDGKGKEESKKTPEKKAVHDDSEQKDDFTED